LPEKVRAALDAADRAELIASKRPEAIGSLLLAGLCEVYVDREAGREFVRRACEIARAHGLPDDLTMAAHGYEGMLWLADGRYDEALAVLRPAAERVRTEEPRFFGMWHGIELVIAHHLAGQHDEAVRVAMVFSSLAA